MFIDRLPDKPRPLHTEEIHFDRKQAASDGIIFLALIIYAIHTIWKTIMKEQK